MIRRKQSAFDQDKSLRRRLAAILTVVAALLGVCAGAADLLVPITASSWSDGAVAGGPKGRLVRMARNELAGLRDSIASGGTGRLLVNVDDDLELGVVVERTSPTRWGYSLSGRVDSPTVGFVTLVVHEETIAGSIWTPYASYEIVPLGSMGDGVHVMREVAYDVHQCGAPVVEHEVERIASVENDHLDDRNTVVDVLMLWTPRTEEEAGGEAAVRVAVELAVEGANDALERSGAFVSLNLVGAEVVDYEDPDEGDSSVLLGRLADPSDGHMDGIHMRRDVLGADLVSLYHRRVCCRAELSGDFSLSSHDPVTFAHEIGHNFGLSHERDEWSGYTATVPGPFEHGHVAGAYREPFAIACAQTIMAYGRRCAWTRSGPPYGGGIRVPVFSSPAIFSPLDGQRLGISRFVEGAGSVGPADAVLHINRVRRAVAAARPSRSRKD